MYMQFPASSTLDEPDCCTCVGSYAPFVIKPDWLALSNTTYMGRQGLINGVEADMWLATTTMDNHYYAAADGSQRALRFMEHKHNVIKQWDFTQYSDAKPDSRLFDTPPNCEKLCTGRYCTV
jgi:hypothetical protein